MVECSRLIVNDYQIRVDDDLLDLQIIAIGKVRDNKIDIFLVGFREREFCSGVLDITYRISGMNSGNIIAIYNITVMNSSKRKRQNTFKMFQCFESRNHFTII